MTDQVVRYDNEAAGPFVAGTNITWPGSGVGEVVKVVGDKVFLLREGVWTDTAFDVERMRPVQVGFMSEDYFSLAAARPEWGAYLAVSERVLVVLPGASGPTAYVVVSQGEKEPLHIPALQPTATPSATETPISESTPRSSPTLSPTARSQAVAPAPSARGTTPFCRGAVAATLLALIAVFPFVGRR